MKAMRMVCAVALVLCAAGAAAQGTESAGMITEIKVGKGRVEVKTASADWRPAAPFLTVRPGDVVRASDNASVVILLSAGRGTVKIQAANSPYTVASAASAGKIEKARTLAEGSLSFLAQGPKEPPKASLSVRGGTKPPVVLSPRVGAVLPGPLTIEWLGSAFSRYTVRVSAPTGVLLDRRGVVGGRFEYPAEAPRLTAGHRYTITVAADRGTPQEAHFEVLDAARADAVRRRLAEAEQGLGGSVSPNTLAALRAGMLAEEGLLHDARLAVVRALAQDPDEPALHTLLGNLYAKAGLHDQAAAEYDEAKFLLGN